MSINLSSCHFFSPCISWAANLSLSSVLRAWRDSFLQKTRVVRKIEILLQVPCRFPHWDVRPGLRCCLRTWIKGTSCWERWNTQRNDVWCVIWNSLSVYIHIYTYVYILGLYIYTFMHIYLFMVLFVFEFMYLLWVFFTFPGNWSWLLRKLFQMWPDCIVHICI